MGKGQRELRAHLCVHLTAHSLSDSSLHTLINQHMNKAIIRTSWIDNLRSFLTVLVVAHHSSLAYTTFAKFDKTNYMSSTAPVVDNSRWIVMDIFAGFNDIFFMSLMFL